MKTLLANLLLISASASAHDFAFDLYKQLAQDKGNIFFSPFSIQTVLSMATDGAQGSTQSEMQKALHLNSKSPQEFKMLLAAFKANQNFKLSLANRMWGQRGLPFENDYLKDLNQNYGSDLASLDFKKKTEESRITINTWVEEQTQNKIRDLLEKGMLTPNTAFVLTNAVYFKADWQSPFQELFTKNHDFYVTPQKKKSVPFMRQVANFPYGETPDFQRLQMPYKGQEMVMDVILPHPKVDLKNFEAQMNSKFIFSSPLTSTEVDVRVPKVDLKYKNALQKSLKQLGIHLAFDSKKADFQKILKHKSGLPQLSIDTIIHQATLVIDEKGTEAAAATALMGKGGSPPPPQPKIFEANRPFYIFIRHVKTGTLLFMGRVSEP